jgi:hypothetical protein
LDVSRDMREVRIVKIATQEESERLLGSKTLTRVNEWSGGEIVMRSTIQ